MRSIQMLLLTAACLAGMVACDESEPVVDSGFPEDTGQPADTGQPDATEQPDVIAMDVAGDAGSDAIADDGSGIDAAEVAVDAAADGTSTPDAAGSALFEARLMGGQEVPAVNSPYRGTVVLTLNAAQTQLSWTVQHDVGNATAGHIHRGVPGRDGPPVITFTTLTSPITGNAQATPQLVRDLQDGLLYVNLHTSTNPDGEVRGQLIMPGESLYTTTMAGPNEVPPVGTPATGGFGVMVSADQMRARYIGSFEGMVATAAHIHRGAPGVGGPVVYPLGYTGTTLAGVLTFTATDLATLESGGFYVNVHSAAYPDGEIRGNLARR